MTQDFKTDQESFWAGSFGQDYVERNKNEELLQHKTYWLARILARTNGLQSFIEFGANIGLNCLALRSIFPGVESSAVEINATAAQKLRMIQGLEVHQQSVLQFQPQRQRDLVLTMGFLIHVNPDALHEVYAVMARTSKRYVCIIEYYNPKPVSIDYRGEKDKLFKRDFAGDFTIAHPEFKLLDYGFVYHRDAHHPLDDLNWFLLEKSPDGLH